jgi:voltage-gated potassium channel Kch
MMRAMSQNKQSRKLISWRSGGALFFFFSAMIGFELGVGVSERPEIVDAGILVKAYYSLSLFVVGGVDLGTPFGGPAIGRLMVWLAYFGSPILAASALMETLLRALAPQRWQLKRLKDHIIVVGDEDLSLAYLRVLRKHNSKVQVVVVSSATERIRRAEFEQDFDAIVVNGDITHEFFLRQLKVERARKILLLDDNSLRSYEAASILINLVPGIGSNVVIHCGSLRFMRAMENTRVAKSCETFNTYHLAASGLVRSHLVHRFADTRAKDIVVIAGFGRFGQTILEELQLNAADEMATVVIIDQDAHRRVMVADEQMEFSGGYERRLYEGDISNPEVWERIRQDVPVTGKREAVFVLGTGQEEANLRTALWIRRGLPEAMIIARSSKESHFAREVGDEHDILSISINQLVEENIPDSWIHSEH